MKLYYNYRRNEKELNEEIIFCSDNPEDNSHYGNIQRIFKATNRTDKKYKKILKYASDFYNVPISKIKREVLPDKIVSSAGVWDDIEFINYLYEDTDYFNEHDGIVTPDGAVFFEVNKNNLVSQKVLEKKLRRYKRVFR